MNFSYVITTLLSSIFCSVFAGQLISNHYRSVANRIVGGREAKPHSHPYQVSLQKKYLWMHRHNCGGSIITSNWALNVPGCAKKITQVIGAKHNVFYGLSFVLTAAHCVTENLWSFLTPYDVFAGIHSVKGKESSKQVRRVVEKIIHPDYKGDVNPNDIALLRVKDPFEFNAKVQPIRLAERDTTPEGGSNSSLSGWGLLKTSPTSRIPEKLQEIVLPIITFQECNESIESFRDGPDDRNPLDECSNVCTGPLTGGKSACNGDSGGPLTQTENGVKYQIGIVSWGISPCGSKGAPTVYTKVSSFIDFIEEHLDLEDDWFNNPENNNNEENNNNGENDNNKENNYNDENF